MTNEEKFVLLDCVQLGLKVLLNAENKTKKHPNYKKSKKVVYKLIGKLSKEEVNDALFK